jgi:hypothetical protein
MDVAWALLELRLRDDPVRDPNAEWAAITSEYLHILRIPSGGGGPCAASWSNPRDT